MKARDTVNTVTERRLSMERKEEADKMRRALKKRYKAFAKLRKDDKELLDILREEYGPTSGVEVVIVELERRVADKELYGI